VDISAQITDIITLFSYWGISFLMLLENVIPPIPSELIMPLAGFAAARGEMNLWGAIASGTVGSVLGALAWYYVGQALGLKRTCDLADRYGKWLGVSSKEVTSVHQWFCNRSGYWAVGFGRLVPSVRTYISVPAGISQMPMGKFLLISTLGSLGWISLLAIAGYWLGENYEKVSHVLGPIGIAVLVVLAAAFVGWLLYSKSKQKLTDN
jgi:membrane protein DedA with SNARE-associated domain